MINLEKKKYQKPEIKIHDINVKETLLHCSCDPRPPHPGPGPHPWIDDDEPRDPHHPNGSGNDGGGHYFDMW